MNRILLVEDDALIVENLVAFLKTEGFDVRAVPGQKEALELLDTERFDLALLDITLQNGNGFSLCGAMRQEYDVPVIFLTALNAEQDVINGYEVGADEYITKPFSPEILMARIKFLLKRCNLLLEHELQIEALQINYRQRTVSYNNQRVFLTPKEFELLYYLVNNRKIALSREQILNQVWGYDYYGDTRTVDTHIKCLRAKLGDFGNYIMTVRKFGYKLDC